ncbi:PepSY-associated TM helix domain-containing protein [Labrys okinawensis]|uniref:PepSY-associated TM helix domain-containing protein n=1 Tax=Labrys okinawensis TaxID=346911 RepID=UPI0039BCE7EB
MSDASSTASTQSSFFRLSLQRAIWRWHFYAGLFSVPFLILLAVTGSLYLFKDEINHTLFAYRTVVTAPGTAELAPSILASRAVLALPGSMLTAFAEPATPTSSAVATVRDEAGKYFVYVDPYTGKVLDMLRTDREPMWLLKKIHSLELFGTFTNRLIEAVGGFALILVTTGIYLWWPRGQAGGVVTIRGTPERRVWWRDLHAVTGAFAGVVIFFLAATGLPWSGYWGNNLNLYAGKAGIGYPAQLWDDVPKSAIPAKDVLNKAGWTVENTPVPLSTASDVPSIGLDEAVGVARKAGIAPGFEMAVPGDETGVYTAAIFPDDLSKERTIHIDQYSGKPLVDLAFSDYGPVGKAIEFGINVHQGQEWGLLNQFVMLATCLAIILASVSGVVMWWKRRPAGKVGVPPYPADPKVYRALWVVAIAVGIALPITGLAILTMVAADLLIIRTIPPLRRAFA